VLVLVEPVLVVVVLLQQLLLPLALPLVLHQ
jgi:hypothetical protein